jgi:Tfp pilus assembly protein PilN
MKNSQRQAAMYIGLGVLIAIVVLLASGRLRTERYEEPVSDAELEQLLGELTQEGQSMEGEMEMEGEMTATGPSMDYDSDSE